MPEDDDRLRAGEGAHRPKEPLRDYDKYPTKLELSLQLAAEFKKCFELFNIKSVQADCFFGTKVWTNGMGILFPKAQVISQLKGNQIITSNNKEYCLKEYFGQRVGIKAETVIRGGKSVVIYYSSVIATVKAHGEKRLIVAYKYQGEAQYRYVFAKRYELESSSCNSHLFFAVAGRGFY